MDLLNFKINYCNFRFIEDTGMRAVIGDLPITDGHTLPSLDYQKKLSRRM